MTFEKGYLQYLYAGNYHAFRVGTISARDFDPRPRRHAIKTCRVFQTKMKITLKDIIVSINSNVVRAAALAAFSIFLSTQASIAQQALDANGHPINDCGPGNVEIISPQGDEYTCINFIGLMNGVSFTFPSGIAVSLPKNAPASVADAVESFDAKKQLQN